MVQTTVVLPPLGFQKGRDIIQELLRKRQGSFGQKSAFCIRSKEKH
jgi:hypothetical protein